MVFMGKLISVKEACDGEFRLRGDSGRFHHNIKGQVIMKKLIVVAVGKR